MSERKFYIVNGKQVPLKKVRTSRLVVPERNYPLHNVSARLGRSSRLGVESAMSPNFLVVRGASDKIEELDGYRDVKHTRSAFTDARGHELILTDCILVKFKPDVSLDEREKLVAKIKGIRMDSTLPMNAKDSGDIWRIRIVDKNEDAPLDIANKLNEEKKVIFSEPDILQKNELAVVPSGPVDFFLKDAMFHLQWHLYNTGQEGGKVGADVNAMGAWKETFGSPDIRVVIHDTGVDTEHPDLRGNIEPGWDFDNMDTDTTNDYGPHGTACAGIVAAVRNKKGGVGIAPECRIVPLKAAAGHTWWDWAQTFMWAAGNGDIVSCSWGLSESNILSRAIQFAAEDGRNGKGLPIFFASGNGGIPVISYPASLPEVMAVGASTNRDLRADFSQYGTGLDFVAPGTDIATTDIHGEYGYNDRRGAAGNYFTKFSGTSASTPLAAGVAALMLSMNPNLTAQQVRNTLRETAVKIDPQNAQYDADGLSALYGYGRIDAAAAVLAAKNL